VTLVVTQSTAHPPAEPDHGLNETTFAGLWAGDEDVTNETTASERLTDTETGLSALATVTDIPLDRPPEAAEQWNRGDLREFPATDPSRSIHPADARLQNGTYVRDAYAAIFAITPSTKAHLTPVKQPLFVAANGTVLGTTDYRIDVPADNESENQSVSWHLVNNHLTTRLLVDGRVETVGGGSHTPTLSYTALDRFGQSAHTLTLEATISATLRKEVRECTDWRTPTNSSTNTTDNGNQTTTGDNETAESDSPLCTEWQVTNTTHTDSVTVRDNVDISVYTLSVSGFQTQYPNGDLGLTVYKNLPWRGYSAGTYGVNGVWRFYGARNPAWDTLVTTTGDGKAQSHSPLHPVQVHAYPVETGSTPTSRTHVRLLHAYGSRLFPPLLQPDVQLDVVDSLYTVSYGLAARVRTTNHDVSQFTVYGLVRGVNTKLASAQFSEVPFHRSNLTVTFHNSSTDTATVEISLRDATTGDPIETQDREGYVLVRGHRINTSADGTATVELNVTGSSVAARYEPGWWWRTQPAYTSDADVAYQGTSTLNLFRVLYQTGIPVGLFLLGVFLIDRITGWDLWPLWGRR
jgi:hypothetical protein